MPHLCLRSPKGLLAHVAYDGTICVSDNQGLSLDQSRHADIVAHTVIAGYELLEKSSLDATSGRGEFFNELEGYWLSLPDVQHARSAVEVDGNDRLIRARVNENTSPPRWYFIDKDTPPPQGFPPERPYPYRALYVHLPKFPPPPVSPEALGTAFVEAVRGQLSAEQLKLWSNLTGPSNNGPKRLALLVSTPRAEDSLSLVGAVFEANRGMVNHKGAVTPLTIRRHTPTYMRERGGASLKLLKKHVVIIGCGAVGSVVADTLAATGIGRLTLVDKERYSEDNVFRHILDPLFIDSHKVDGLKLTLERRYPGIQVVAEAARGQDWLKTANLADVDGFVLALGAPSVERYLSNECRRKATTTFPMVFTWLEPLDLGGHSILTWSNREGCLDCLYRDDEGQSTLSSRTSFLEPNQHISRNLTGCASTFIPFGALQARRTGLLATEHILSAFHCDRDTGASYRFWVGNGESATTEGLKTTHWWKTADGVSPNEATLRVFGFPCNHCQDDR